MPQAKHDLERKIAEAVSAALKARPSDPLAFIGEVSLLPDAPPFSAVAEARDDLISATHAFLPPNLPRHLRQATICFPKHRWR